MKINNLVDKAKDALIQCLQDIPFVSIDSVLSEPVINGKSADLLVQLRTKDQTWMLIGEVKSDGQPLFARQAVYQLLHFLSQFPTAYGVFIAPYISPASAAICREADIGYVDLAGNCFLAFDQVYIQREGNPNPFNEKRYLRSLYSPKSERLLRVLLAAGRKQWKVEELAREAQVSLGQVANVKQLLREREWLKSETVGFGLSEPAALLEEWSQNYKFRRNRVLDYYTIQEISSLEYRLAEVCQDRNIRYGLTGFSGAARYAPSVRYQRAMAFVQYDLESLATGLDIKPVTSGANLSLFIPYDEGVFYAAEVIGGVRVVSPTQIYLDLKGYRGRGEEAAETLFNQVIKIKW